MVSCSEELIIRDNTIEVTHFEKNISLEAVNCPSMKDDIFPLTMGINRDVLLLCDGMSDPHLYLYNLPSLEFLGEYVSQGKGPSEMLDPIFWGQFVDDENSLGAWFYEPNRMRYSLIDFNNLIDSGTVTPLKTYIMPPQLGAAVNLINIDNYIIAGGRCTSGEFLKYTPDTKEKEFRPFIVEFSSSFMKDLSRSGLMKNLKQGVLKVKPDGSHFVKAYSYLPIIDIYDHNAELKFSIINDKLIKPDINFSKKLFNPNTRVYNTNVFLTDRFIYVANNNCSLQELSEEKANNVLIEVYSWEGRPLVKFDLNEGIGPMAPFVVDEKNEMIYTMSPKVDGRCFSQFNIKGFLPIY